MTEIIRIDTQDERITAIHFDIIEDGQKWYKKLTVDIPFADQSDKDIKSIIESEMGERLTSLSNELKARALAKSRIQQRRPFEVAGNGKKSIRFRGRSDDLNEL